MGVYQSNGSTIGNLLRAIQEEKSQSPLGAPPQTEAGSPIRGLTQGSLLQTESPDSSRAVVIRPELSPTSAGGAFDSIPPVQAPVPPAPSPVVNPVNPVIDAAPATPAQPTEFAPSRPAPTNTSPQAVSLGTKINSLPAPTGVSATLKSVANTPKATQVQKPPTPSPTPAPQRPKQSAPQPSRVGQFIADAFKQLQGLGTKIFGSTSKTLARR